jgi:hypothetical protein
MKRFSTVLAVIACAALASGAAAKDQKTGKVSERGEKIVCKKFLETGSLVRGYRECKTEAEWARERANLRPADLVSSCRNSGQTGGC